MKKRSIICRLFVMSLLMFSFSILTVAQDVNGDRAKGDRPVRITHKPTPGYTEEARENGINGTVKLEITFQSDGTIGEIACVNEDGDEKEKLIKYGLVTAAIMAAQQITFEPEMKKGKPVTVKKITVYGFSIY